MILYGPTQTPSSMPSANTFGSVDNSENSRNGDYVYAACASGCRYLVLTKTAPHDGKRKRTPLI